MRLLAIGVCLVAVFHLATAQPPQDQAPNLKGKLKSNFYYISSGGRRPREQAAEASVLSSREEAPVHSRARRSAAQQFVFVSQPRVPRFTYIRVYQHLPEPEPEPEPAPLPPPMVEEARHLEEVEHHDQEDEDHHEEDEDHETHVQVLEAAEQPTAVQPQPAVEVPAAAAVPGAEYEDIISMEETEHRRKDYNKKKKTTSWRLSHPKKHHPTHAETPVQPRADHPSPVQPNAVHPSPVQPASPIVSPMFAPLPHMIVANPPPPRILYNKMGMTHIKVETAPGEQLDLVPLPELGRWGVEVEDTEGRNLGYLPVGHGGLDFIPILGRGGHVDWVMEGRDAQGLVHDIHLKSTHEHLKMGTVLTGGKPVTGVMGFDYTGDILMPMKVQPLPHIHSAEHFKTLHHYHPFKHFGALHHYQPLKQFETLHHYKPLKHFQQPYLGEQILHPTPVVFP